MSDLFERVDLFGPEFEKNRERQKLNEQWVRGIDTPHDNWLHLQDAVWALLRHSSTLTQRDRDVLDCIDTVCRAQRDRCRQEKYKSRN